MMNNVVILQRLYSLKEVLSNVEEKFIINEFIEKYEFEINVESSKDFTSTQILRSSLPFYRLFESIAKEYFPAKRELHNFYQNADFDVLGWEKSNSITEEADELSKSFSILKLKIKNEGCISLRVQAVNTLNIIATEKFKKLIFKYLKNDSSK